MSPDQYTGLRPGVSGRSRTPFRSRGLTDTVRPMNSCRGSRFLEYSGTAVRNPPSSPDAPSASNARASTPSSSRRSSSVSTKFTRSPADPSVNGAASYRPARSSMCSAAELPEREG